MKKYIALFIVLIFAITGWAFPPTPPTNMASPGAIGGTTPAAGTFTTLKADHIGETTGSHGVVFDNNIDIGSTTAGKNVNVYATLGEEMAPALEAANWTATDGWSAGSGVLTKIAGTGTGTATPSGTFSVTAGRRYQVTIVCSAVSGSLTYTLGGVTGTTITATTITDNIVAATTGKIIFSGGAAVTATITSVSVQEATDGTGDLTVGGDLTVKTNTQLNGPLTLYKGISSTYPAIWIPGMANGYLYQDTNGWIRTNLAYASANALISLSDTGYIAMGASRDIYLYRDAAATLAQRNSTTQQIFRLYNTYTNASNYERLSLTGVQGASVNVTAETAGTGGDNLDIVLTPAGTGTVKTASSIFPVTDDTYYLGKNDDDSPAAWKGVILKDTANGKYYRIEITNGTIVATDLTD